MGVYDGSVVKSSNSFNVDQLVTELSYSMPMRYSATSASSVINTTSTSYADAMTLSVALEADEVFLVLANAMVSCGTSGNAIRMTVSVNGSDQAVSVGYTSQANNTNGDETVLTVQHINLDTSGTIDIKIRWKVASGAGTIYMGDRYLTCMRWKRRNA